MRFFIIPACVVILASCTSMQHNSTKAGYVQVLSSGMISVNGKRVPVDKVGPALKARGFGPRSPINIHVTNDVSAKIMKMVTVSLTRSGFTRIMFVKPKQTSADVKSGLPGK